MKNKLIALFFALAAPAIPARADVQVNFSGGSGAPLTMTLPFAIEYTLTTAVNNQFLSFMFDGVGNPFGEANYNIIGSITYTVDSQAAQTIDYASSGTTAGDLTADDVIAFGLVSATAPMGTVITLSAGTITTTSNVAAAAPASGSFAAYVGNFSGIRQSGPGAAVPEPGAYAAALGAAALAAAAVGKKHRARDAAAVRQPAKNWRG